MTYIPHREWVGQDVIRIQVDKPNEKMRWGPEIPVDQLGDFVSGIVNLLYISGGESRAETENS